MTRAASTARLQMPSGSLRSFCSECEETATQPDKGVGRTTLTAWESRHGRNCPHRDRQPNG